MHEKVIDFVEYFLNMFVGLVGNNFFDCVARAKYVDI